MVQHSNTLPIGSRLEEYRIESILGTGGFGVTYKAWDTHLETWVAIKEYFPIEWSFRGKDGIAVHQTTQGRQRNADSVLSDYQWGLNRFLDEARVLARIKNPFVVRISRYFRANGTAYIVMDYEDGEPLSALLERRGTLPESDILGLLQEVIPALQAVHEQGYLHRDLKPGNLYVRSRDGCVMLIDFGAARYAIGRSSKSVTGLVTPGYSPPEQYAIRSDRYGNWTDIYALGAVLYRCVCGAAPVEAAERLIDDSLRSAQQCGAGRYRPELLAAVDKALALRPDDRYQSVAEIWRDLNLPSTSDVSGEAKRELSPPKSSTAGARQPTWGRIAAMVAVLMLAAGALLWAPIQSVFIPAVNSPVASSGRYLNDISDDTKQNDPGLSGRATGIAREKTRSDELRSIDEATLNNVVLAPLPAVEPNASEELAKGLLALNAVKEREFPGTESEPAGTRATAQDSHTDATQGAEAESELEKLLRLAGESFGADRLTIPYEESALAYFEQALQLDPDNRVAHEGIEGIVQRYGALARREMDKPDYVKAHRFIVRGLMIDANNEPLLEMEKELNALGPPQLEIVDAPAPLPQPDLDMALNPDSR